MIIGEHGDVDVDKLKDMLKMMDRPFVYRFYKSAMSDENLEFLSSYMKKINLVHSRDMTWADSDENPDDPEWMDSEEEDEGDESDEKEERFYDEEWMGEYTEVEIEYLNNYMNDLKNDFKIINRNHVDYARKIAKASLAMDIEYNKMMSGEGDTAKYKMLREAFDSLSKSAQFAESGRSSNDISLGNFGVVFDKVEKNMWVPTHVPNDKDIYDMLLDQFSNIRKSL